MAVFKTNRPESVSGADDPVVVEFTITTDDGTAAGTTDVANTGQGSSPVIQIGRYTRAMLIIPDTTLVNGEPLEADVTDLQIKSGALEEGPFFIGRAQGNNGSDDGTFHLHGDVGSDAGVENCPGAQALSLDSPVGTNASDKVFSITSGPGWVVSCSNYIRIDVIRAPLEVTASMTLVLKK